MLTQFSFYRKLSPIEKHTFKVHLFYSLLEGFILGVFVLNEFVFIKSLKGSNYNMGVLFQFSILALLFSIFFNEYLKRYLNKKKLIRYVALLTRLPLLAFAFFPSDIHIIQQNHIYHYIFLFIFFIYYLASPVVLPLVNLYLKSNYSYENFSKLYSYSILSNKMIMLITTFVFGLILDVDYAAFKYIYPVTGVVGVISLFLLSNLRLYEKLEKATKQHIFLVFKNSIRNSYQILKSNKPYRDFEIGFMFYGIAFMSSIVVITIFYDKALHLNYNSTAFYKNFYNIIAIIFLPFFGRLLTKQDPRKFAIITYLFMGLMILFVGLTTYFPWMFQFWSIKFFIMMIIGYLFFGFFTSSMSLLWDIGSSYFCNNAETLDYLSIHITLTGIRGIFAPLVGITLYELTNFTTIFVFSIACLVVAIAFMYYSLGKKYA